MQSDFFPDRELDMLSWSVNFRAKLSADPAAYGVTPALAQQFATLQQAFADALTQVDPAVRTRVSVATKNEARQAMERMARGLSRIIQGQPSVTDAQRVALGLSIRRPAPSRLPPPAFAPELLVLRVSGNTISLRLDNAQHVGSRARPRGVAGATLMAYVGGVGDGLGEGWPPPTTGMTAAGASGWMSLGNTSVTNPTVTLGELVRPLTSVWLTACWYNPRGESGPACAPVQTWTTHAGPRVGSMRRAA